MYRTHNCGQIRIVDCGQEVQLAGWVQTLRTFGKLTFVDLRDRYGLTQLVFDDILEKTVGKLGREDVIRVKGVVRERSNKNTKIPTGDIEIDVRELSVLNASATPPFTIEDSSDGGEELRMKYRYLDLRRPVLQRNLSLRYRLSRAVRDYLDRQGFLDLETPYLIRSTPEGARDFVVPSRMNEGQFYALPQSPQTFKQLLMVSGFDRYYQIVKCFRDEDLRADRQPEFTQIDCELSFVDQEDILQIFEAMIVEVFKTVLDVNLQEPFPRMSYKEAMRNYGNDKPDLRFEMPMLNLKTGGTVHCPVLENSGFPVLDSAETILAIRVPGAHTYTRKQIDELTLWVKRPQIGMGGMMYIRVASDGTGKSSMDKFFSPEQIQDFIRFTGAEKEDLILILAGQESLTRKAASELRLEMGSRLGLRNPDHFRPLWVLDFPLFEQDDASGRWMAKHHPFTAPKPEQVDLLSQPEQFGSILANAYDLVLNGTEIGGGSIRIFQRALQEKMFAALGMDRQEYMEKFGFLLGAFEYGAPPHGGIALGLDRLAAQMSGQESIRDFIAFPKNNAGRDVMLDAPAALSEDQLAELGISSRK